MSSEHDFRKATPACEAYREAVLDSVGGDPLPVEIAAHVRGCAACRRLVSETERALALVAALPPEPIPAGFAGRVAARARDERRGARRLLGLTAAAAAVLLAAVGTLALRAGTPAAVPPGPEVAALPSTPAEPPAELVDDLELVENLDLLRDLDVLEAVAAVDAAAEWPELVGG